MVAVAEARMQLRQFLLRAVALTATTCLPITAQTPTSPRVTPPADPRLADLRVEQAPDPEVACVELQPDGGLAVEGAGFRASFVDGVRFEIAAGAADEPVELRLRLVGVARRGMTMAAGNVRAEAGERHVDYRHPGVCERYESRPGGLEQTFHFDQRPAGDGDLELRIAVAGSVQAPAVASAHQSLTFTTADQRSIQYGAAFAYDRAGERLPIPTAYDGVGTITLTVPAAFVERATYPLVVDPLIGVSFPLPLDTMAIVLDEANQRYAVASGDRLQLYSRSGVPVFAHRPLPAPAMKKSLAVVHTLAGTTWFVVAWPRSTDHPATSRRFIDGLVVSADNGWQRSFSIPASTLTTPSTRSAVQHVMVAGGRRGMAMMFWKTVQWQGGSVFGPAAFLDTAVYRFHAASFDLGNPVASLQISAPGLVDSCSIAGPGDAAFGPPLRECMTAGDVATTVGGQVWSDYRVVWSHFYGTFAAPQDHDLWTAVLRTRPGAGVTVIGPHPVEGANSILADELQPAIAAVASRHLDPTDLRYLITWADSRPSVPTVVRGRLLGATSSIGVPFTIVSGANSHWVGCGQSDFVSVWKTGSSVLSSFAARIDPSGTVGPVHGVASYPSGLALSMSGDMRAPRLSSRLLRATPTPPDNRVVIAGISHASSTGTVRRGYFFDTVAPQQQIYGFGCPGPWGTAPKVGANGAALLGNSSFAVTLEGVTPGAPAILFYGGNRAYTSIPSAPGCHVLASEPLAVLVSTVADGAGLAQCNVPIPFGLPVGTRAVYQWLVQTPGFNPYGGVLSDALDILWTH